MAFTTGDRRASTGATAPSAPRLQWGPTLGRRAVLHGAWWPRSNDPLRELPGLIVEIDDRRGGPVTCVMLGPGGWESRAPRLRVGSRLVRVGWFTTQSDSLLTASFGDQHNVELLIIPHDTGAALADAAMAQATRPDNRVRATDMLATVAREEPQPG